MTEPTLDVYARPQHLVRINSHRRLNLLLTGVGRPTVILAHGLGGRTLEWWRVQTKASEFAKVISYDRAGFGFSDTASLPRTTDRILSDLRAALKAVGEAPPYILVSHSAGNFEMRLFAFKYLKEVAGMVLVDPSGSNQSERGRAIAPWLKARDDEARARFKSFERWAREGRLVPGSVEYDQCVGSPNSHLPKAVNDALRDWSLRPSSWRSLYSEDLAMSRGTNDRILDAAHQSLGSLPLIVLTAGRIAWNPELSAREVRLLTELWTALHEEHAALSTRGIRRDVPDSAHSIHIEQPDTVVAAIREVIELARA
jgi:pimeloyl-ACP methyl ester carboxylesterase